MHQQHCPVINRTAFNDHSDAAKRVSDVYNMHRVADPYGNVGYWIACALADGTSDNVLYQSRADAMSHQHNNENNFTYVQIVPSTITPCESEVMLKVSRMAHKGGMRHTDGLSRHDLIKRLGWEDQLALSDGIAQNLRFGRN